MKSIPRHRQLWGFFYRDWQLTRRYWSWVLVFTFYAVVTAATVALIGVAAKDPTLTLNLTIGAVMWTFLSVLFNEIAMSVAYERWEGTLEYTFMAPVSRFIHLMGVSLFGLTYGLFRIACVLGALVVFIDLPIRWEQLPGLLLVLVVASVAFIGLGLMAATLPVISPERGAEATNIFQGILLLISGIYYPIEVLPAWLQPFSLLSPATYALRACRKLLGLSAPASGLAGVSSELAILALMGVVLVPLGLLVFGRAEAWAKRHGKLKRTG